MLYVYNSLWFVSQVGRVERELGERFGNKEEDVCVGESTLHVHVTCMMYIRMYMLCTCTCTCVHVLVHV